MNKRHMEKSVEKCGLEKMKFPGKKIDPKGMLVI